MSAADTDVLARALEEHSPAVISSGEGTARRDVLVTFTTARTDASGAGFWARVHVADGKLIERLIKSGEEVSVSFNTPRAKISFKTVVLKKGRRHFIHKLLLLKWPERIAVVEQRQKPRVWVPDRYRLAAKIETLSAGSEVLSFAPVRVWDIGLEGASVIIPNHFTANLIGEVTIRLTIQPPDTEKTSSYLAVQRHLTRLSDQKLRLGLQFMPTSDPSTAPAQRMLKGLINELDSVCGAHAMMGELRNKLLKPVSTVRGERGTD